MLNQKLFCEFLGTAFLIIAVVGSGIMAENLAQGNIALALLANAIATGAALYVLIQVFGSFSGAHFNPAVSAYFFVKKQLTALEFSTYTMAQILGGLFGVLLTHIMFDINLFQISTNPRNVAGLFTSEIIATFGLLLTIVAMLRSNPAAIPTGVALYITGAYWFTSSTSFANPAVTIARMFTNTFTGIAPTAAGFFIGAQVVGLGIFIVTWSFIDRPHEANKLNKSQ